MFRDTPAFGSYSVDDLDKARHFYRETLGVRVKEQPGMGLQLEFPKGTTFFVYPKPDHQPATHTVLNLPVDDIDRAVDELTGRGVRFERYEGALKTDDKGIARSPDPKHGPSIAWFRDPAGNFISVLQENAQK